MTTVLLSSGFLWDEINDVSDNCYKPTPLPWQPKCGKLIKMLP